MTSRHLIASDFAPASPIAGRTKTLALRASALLALLFAALLPARVAAQGAARVLDLDPSIRAAGAGGACNAVFWGGDPNEWANPALLGYSRGFRFSWGRTLLVPDFSDDVVFESQRFTLGLGGLGLAASGNPEGFGETELSYGTLGFPEEAPFEPGERVASWGVGLSLAEMARTIARNSGEPMPEAFRYFDLAAGMNCKIATVSLAPGEGTVETAASDWGVLVRLTPIDTFDEQHAIQNLMRFDRDDPHGGQGGRTFERDRHERRSRGDRGRRDSWRLRDRPTPTRVDLSYGFSVINADDASISFFGGPLYPTSRIYRHGVSAFIASGRAWKLSETPWLARALTPLISMGFAADHEHVQAGDFPSPSYDVQRIGAELTLMNILSLRTGYVNDETGQIQDTSIGVGVGFDFGRYAGFRLDWARIPQAEGLSRVERTGFTVYVDPIAILSSADRPRRVASRDAEGATLALAPR